MLVTCCALFAGYDFLTRRRMMALMERSAELRAQSALAKNRHTFLSMARGGRGWGVEEGSHSRFCCCVAVVLARCHQPADH